MKKVVAIGGGRGTKAIDREIIRLARTNRPKVLLIPTASSDDEGYCEHFHEYFGRQLRCKTDVLLLIREKPTRTAIRKKILSADIVYVSGGNTLKMMRLWRRFGVDRALQNAYKRGIVLCGMSAGSICWFNSGHSDSMSFHNPNGWKYINVRGLGLIKGVHCPHYNGATAGVPRRRDFQEMIARIGGFGIAIEDHCAIEFLDGKHYRVIASNPRAGAYRVYRKNGEIVSERIGQKLTWSPTAELYKRY